jgi:hypothetical protein
MTMVAAHTFYGSKRQRGGRVSASEAANEFEQQREAVPSRPNFEQCDHLSRD